MLMTTTLNHDLPLLAAGQAQKHVTLNEALVQIDAALQLSVASASLAVPPPAPPDGARYIVPPAGSGVFAGRSGQIAWFDAGAWRFVQPREGWLAYDRGTQAFLSFDGSAWRGLPLGTPDMLGINTGAAADRRLSVASDTTLLTHDGHDHRLVINKALTADTATVLFQKAFSGRAEFGLSGSDQFTLKVSGDGAQWRTALTVDPATGHMSAGGIAPAAPLHIAAAGDVRLLLQPLSGANNRESYIDFGSTFDNYAADTTVRQAARIRAGFAGGVWGTEFLSFGVGDAFGPNDAPAERARLTAAGLAVTGSIKPAAVAKAALPSASQSGAGAMLMVTDEAGGPVIAFSDGTAWRRVTDRAVVA
jgi:hypothetical protein